MSSLRPYHATLVGESYLGRKRPVYECTEMQVCPHESSLHYTIFSYFLFIAVTLPFGILNTTDVHYSLDFIHGKLYNSHF